ncbi:DinG family ATP-dependent helicase YoaA [hydrothermal vent metagenome]|uniref:DinG family ATP-dependent helicase YoaA n=1 Tax=hydrothermal vent metagenome TaxID=652676 RepID=A0A3B0Y4Q4_9ZZZZ
MSSAADLLGATGVFANALLGFRAREGQQALSAAIEAVIADRQVLVAEAGTGIGKTFAYLVPAIMSGKKTIISTGTRHLQDQLFHNDIPVVRKALKMDLPCALLKGRANYLCQYRLNIAHQQAFLNRQTQDHLSQIQSWSKQTSSGDMAEMSGISEDARVWPIVTSTSDNCLGNECSEWSECFVVKARKQAQEADIVVVNHHLLLADMAIREEGFGELLPAAETFIIDEAHQLPEVASRFFGTGCSSRQINNLISDSISEQLKDAGDMHTIREACDELKTSNAQFRLTFGAESQRDAWQKIRYKPALQQAREKLLDDLEELMAQLHIAAERGKGLEQCYARSALLFQSLKAYGETEQTETPSVYWYETFSKGYVLHATPLDVAALFKQQRDALPGSWIFTSATLEVGKDFSHFAQRLGLENYQQGNWNSPFDYQQQSLLYLPENLPDPASFNYTEKLIEAAIPVLQASKGRAFILFTSYRALNEAVVLLQRKLEYPILVQGSLPKHPLLLKFRALGNAVLLGTASFWEGVDVRGEALSCVIIDKLPFASPGDPVMQARLEAIRGQGGNPFMDYQLPQAVITLKQGAGRLIRDMNDYGVLMIGDNRISTKRYGSIFLKSLPDMPVSQRLIDVEAFYDSWNDERAKNAGEGAAEPV